MSLSRPVVEAPDTHTPDLQALPLEAVWAVETARQPQSTFSPIPDESDRHIFGGEDIERPGERTNTDQTSVQRTALRDDIVRSALQDVHTAQATDSGIEFIPPRRPRPVSHPAGSYAPVREKVDPPAETAQATVQRQADSSPQNEIVEPGVVPTEIGPLPEDLWKLVGAESPLVRKEAPQERPASGNASKWKQQLSLNNASLPASPLGQTGQAAVVQRQVTPPAGLEPTSAPAAVGEEAVGEQAGEEMDIEELARQVYSELRHRLELEWERLRRHK